MSAPDSHLGGIGATAKMQFQQQPDGCRVPVCSAIAMYEEKEFGLMLLVTPDDQRYALSQAADARERAESATTDEDRRYWLDTEIRWNELAGSHAFVQRLNDFSHSIEATHCIHAQR